MYRSQGFNQNPDIYLSRASNPAEKSKANFALRRTVALGAIGLSLATGAIIGKDVIRNSQESAVMGDIERAGEHAVQQYQAGEFDEEKVTAVAINTPQSASAAAANLTPNDKNLMETQKLITGQTGPYVEGNIAGQPELLILPKSHVRDQYEQP